MSLRSLKYAHSFFSNNEIDVNLAVASTLGMYLWIADQLIPASVQFMCLGLRTLHDVSL